MLIISTFVFASDAIYCLLTEWKIRFEDFRNLNKRKIINNDIFYYLCMHYIMHREKNKAFWSKNNPPLDCKKSVYTALLDFSNSKMQCYKSTILCWMKLLFFSDYFILQLPSLELKLWVGNWCKAVSKEQ